MALRNALLGAGRIGQAHSRAVAQTAGAELVAASDVNAEAARAIADQHQCQTASLDEIADNPNIDAVLICTPTDLHAEQIEKFVIAGKAVFCEKPIDLDISKVNQCKNELKDIKTPIQIGFNRRFDLSHSKVQESRAKKEIGELEMIVITSRDPAAPGLDYLNAAGGFFRDTTIHDFDLSRFILGNDPIVEVSAFGENLFDQNVRIAKDFDTAMFILKS